MPVIGGFFTRYQIEVSLPNTKVANSVLELLRDYPQCTRIWIHSSNVDSETVERIHDARPDVIYRRYD